ncbi:MAG: hypothetical protein WCF99_04350 [Chloroflexales bacterium]
MNANRQKERPMQITTPNLIRWGGLSAMVTGIIFAGIQPIHPPDVLASVTTSSWAIITTVKTVMCLFGLFGIAGLYARQVEKTGWLGLTGYLLLTIFYAVQMCFAFTEPLILPLLATESPKFVAGFLGILSSTPSEVSLGALPVINGLLAVLYLLGTLLFGIAMFRARILSRGAAGLLAVSGPLAIILTMIGHPINRIAAVPMGIALIWLGYSLWSERRVQTLAPVSGEGSIQFRPTGAD